MSGATSARDEVLGRIRAALGEARARGDAATATRQRFPAFAAGLGSTAARVARFRERLAAVRGESAVVRDVEAAGEVLGAWLRARGADTLAVGDGPLALAVARATRRAAGTTLLEPPTERAALLAASAGLTGATLGVAETGTLVLTSADERARLASLLPPLAVAVLPVDALEATLDEALARLRPGDPATSSRALTLVTGPSRTADIEMTLVVGVHGPEQLLVLLVDPDASDASDAPDATPRPLDPLLDPPSSEPAAPGARP